MYESQNETRIKTFKLNEKMNGEMSGKDKKPYGKSVYRSFVMVMQFGINMLVPICLMSALGVFLDRKFGTSYIMVILFFVGAVAGAQNIYRMAKKIFDEPDERIPGINDHKSDYRNDHGNDYRSDVTDETFKKD